MLLEKRLLGNTNSWHGGTSCSISRGTPPMSISIAPARTRRKLPRSDVFVGAFDLFRIGIGPSSSHTVGPMRAAVSFLTWTAENGTLARADRISCDLFGSLALTGVGHGTDVAVIAGLNGAKPETIDPDDIPVLAQQANASGRIGEGPARGLSFFPKEDVRFRFGEFLPGHPNAMTFTLSSGGEAIVERTYYSIGGGFVEAEGEKVGRSTEGAATVPYPYRTSDEMLLMCRNAGSTIAQAARANEEVFRSSQAIDDGLDAVWSAMKSCVSRGMGAHGILPGGLSVKRRAASLLQTIREREQRDQGDPFRAMEWVNLFALAVNEENAGGGRVVTAPTNGAAGIIPAVLHYYDKFVVGASVEGVREFLLVSAAIGSVIKRNASISGADVGCQGEVGSASAMAAAGLAAVMGGTNEQVENAAEIALEHSLGLTCDPVGGLVQVPCIERNAVASVKAINAARLAMHGDGTHRVSLDQAIETMRQTGRDMKRKYKETSEGGLAVNVPLC